MDDQNTTEQAAEPKRRGSTSNKVLEGRINEQAEQIENIVGAVEELQEASTAADAKLDSILSALSGMSAQNRGGVVNPTIEPMEFDQGGGGAAEFTTTGELEPARVLDVESPEFKAKMDYEKFMAERLTVMIHETNEEDADQHFSIGVNGRNYPFRRGETKQVPRYVVYGLCQCRPMRYKNHPYTDNEGNMAVRYDMSRGLRYPFSVVNDPNPRGPAWLARALAEK